MSEITTRPMTAEDWPYVSKIYLEGIATEHATFQTTCPPYTAWDASHTKDCRLVVLDEAFSKMDAEKVASCIDLRRSLGFQAIISATNDKIQNYIENVDKTFVYANLNKKNISIQEFEKKEFDQLKQDISGDEDGEEV